MTDALRDVLWNTVVPGAAAWLATYAVHSTILIGGAWLATAALRMRHLLVQDLLWKAALLGGIVTASLQLTAGVRPFAGQLTLPPLAPPQPVAAEALPASAATVGESGRLADVELSPASEAGAVLPSGAPMPVDGSPSEWTLALLALWGLGAIGYLVVLALSLAHLKQLLRGRVPLRGGSLPEILEHLRARARCTRRVDLTASPQITVPFALAREICVPHRAAVELTRAQQESMLAHELAHVVRRDPSWLRLARLVESVLFFQPLNRLARRRLQEGAEYLCDDWVVAQTGHGLTLARCLTEVAEWTVEANQPLAVVGMVDGSTPLRRRVGRLVSGGGASQKRARWQCPAAVGAVALMALMLPGVTSARPDSPAPAPVAPEATPAPVVAPAPVAEAAPVPSAPPAGTPASSAPPAPPATPAAAPPPPREAPPPPREAPPEPAASPQPPSDDIHAEIERISRRIAEIAAQMAPSEEQIRRIEEAARVSAERARLSEEDQARIAELSRQAGEEAQKREAEMAALEHAMQEKVSAARLSPEDEGRLEALAQELAERQDELTPEERERLRAEMREITEKLRPNRAEIERLAREMALLGEQMRPSREELDRMREEARRMSEQVRLSAEQRRQLALEAGTLARETREERRSLERELRDQQRELQRLVREMVRRQARDRERAPSPAPTPEPDQR